MIAAEILEQGYRLLDEIVDGCEKTKQFNTKAIDIYTQKISEYRLLKQFPKLYDISSCDEVGYAMSFVRDYIWFNEEEK
jgi:hypothetical protein